MKPEREPDLILQEIAQRIADNGLIPFIGAGCSAQHVGLDWDGITVTLAADLGSDERDPTAVAERYVGRFGREALVERLRLMLSVERFDDTKGESYLALASLGLRTFYTTNQDNVFERFFEKYDVPYTSVSRPEDLRRVSPDLTILYKYHGDFTDPNTIVFTDEDYAKRAAEDDDFFLNVRLKSHLLAKSLLFVGYSMRDPHVVALIETLAARFPEAMRGSYLLALDDVERLRERTQQLGVEVLPVAAIARDAPDGAAALGRVLMMLTTMVVELRGARALDEFFTGPTGVALVPLYAIDRTLASLHGMPVDAAIRALRALVAGRQIPPDAQGRVAEAFEALAKRVRLANDARDLSFALFGHAFSDVEAGMRVVAATFALHAVPAVDSGLDLSLAPITALPDVPAITALGAAVASELFERWGKPITEGFATWISRAVRGLNDVEALPDDVRSYVLCRFERVFAGSQRTNPLSRRLDPLHNLLPRTGFYDLVNAMTAAMPKTHWVAGEEE